MGKIKADPLLLAAKVIVWFGIAITAFVTVMVTIGLGAVATVARDELLAELAKAGAPAGAFWAIVAAMALILAVMVIGGVFLYTLVEIVRSVDRGDPFDPANARRLAKMGWLSLAAQLATVPLGATALWIENVLPEENGGSFDAEFGFGGGGIVLTLVLFILARVFRKGAEMREELEGTV